MSNRHPPKIPFFLPFFLFAALLLSSACMKTARLTVLQPAQFKLPEHIAKVAIVDRSKPSNGWLNVLEGAFTGESIGQDRASRQQAVAGLTEVLHRTPRFRVVSTGIEMTGSKAGVNLPTPLEWSEIERICADYQTDAVVAIESFDTDNSSSTRREVSKTKDKNGNVSQRIYYDARMRTSVRTGWRLYDPKTRSILDEFVTDDEASDNSTGDTERAALNNLPSPARVSRRIAYVCGEEYGMRIAPVYVNVERHFYAKAKGNGVKAEMREAARFAESGDWEQAADVWKAVERYATGQRNHKAAGRAAYNMAVAAEVQGDLDVALEWAKISWQSHGNKKARAYIYTLQRRQTDAARAEDQMNKKV